ncbi:MAG: heme ABC transporter permease [Alphaproteobacteria bacterium]|nr:heme ABC transporter permease [Alphaproteobacteria bacterium]
MHRFANPTVALRLADRLMPWSASLCAGLFVVGLYYALVASPIDYQQRDTVRIMYVHVPAAWMALGVYAMMATASAVGLVWKHPLADLSAKAAAPIGAGFTLICLVTGALWGQPTWGTWWVWDARLTSVLILFFLYLGYMALWQAYDDPGRAARAAAILALVGVVNLPVIKFSVDWWNTLHQPASVFTLQGPKIDPSMLKPLMLMAGAYLAFFVTVLIYRLKAEILARRASVLRRARAEP